MLNHRYLIKDNTGKTSICKVRNLRLKLDFKAYRSIESLMYDDVFIDTFISAIELSHQKSDEKSTDRKIYLPTSYFLRLSLVNDLISRYSNRVLFIVIRIPHVHLLSKLASKAA